MTAGPATTLVLVRHGESNVTVNRVIGGYRSCSGLSGLGRRQADRLRERLATTLELTADVLISSNFAARHRDRRGDRAGVGQSGDRDRSWLR